MIIDIDELFKLLKEFGQERKWHLKYAKFNRRIRQSLLSHCLNVGSLSYSLLDYLDEQKFVKATDKLRIQVLLTGFIHDAGKEKDSYQRAVQDYLDGKGPEPLDFGHQQDKDIRPTIESMQKFVEDKLPSMRGFATLWDEIVWSISHLGKSEDAASVSQNFQRAPSNDALLCKEIVHIADLMMSQFTVEDAASVSLDGQTVSKLQFTYSKVATVRGVLTQFLHVALESQFRNAGFRPVQWFPDGTVYVGTAGVEVPKIDSAKLVDEIVKKIQDVLDKNIPLIAKAAYGNYMHQVIAAPEFLFVNEKVIHEFWQYISAQKSFKPNSKKLEDLKDKEKIIYKYISDQLMGKDESTKLTFLSRFNSDFNLLIVLFGARKGLVEKAKDAGADDKKVKEEATKCINKTLAQVLEIPLEDFDAWPDVRFQTETEERLPVVKTLWQSPYYKNPDKWNEKFLQALEKATIELESLWRRYVPDRYRTVAKLLVSDVTHPLNSKELMETVKELNEVIAEGKIGHGTPTCQRCGAKAIYEAQAELFGESQIYHDHLVAGSRIEVRNKIRVCEICEFEEKLRSVFLTRGNEPFSTFYIFPHLALSRNQQLDWQSATEEIKQSAGRFPSFLQVNQWAELVLEDDIPSPSLLLEKSGPSQKELERAIQKVAKNNGFEEDLSSMIEPPLEAKDAKAIVSYLNQGKCKLKEKFQREVEATLNRLEPIYLSPNFVLLLANDTVADRDEPESSVAIKWLFFRLLLARYFSATVLSGDSVREEGAMLGYTTVPSNIVLRPLVEKLGIENGWVPIPRLETTLKKLSALILTARELSYADADYGNATLLRLLNEEPGRVLVRMINKNQAYPKELIFYLDTWNYGE